MGDKKLLIAVDEFTTLRLQCTHCQACAIFSADGEDRLTEARCSSCGRLMADAHHLVNKYREFFADLRRFGKGRAATFEIAWREV